LVDGKIYQEEVICADMIPDEENVQMQNILDSDGGVSIVMGTPESNRVTE